MLLEHNYGQFIVVDKTKYVVSKLLLSLFRKIYPHSPETR